MRTAALLLVLLLAGCKGPFELRSGHNPIDYSALRTYAWDPLPVSMETLGGDRGPSAPPEIAAAIRAAVDAELPARGLRPDPVAPDAVVWCTWRDAGDRSAVAVHVSRAGPDRVGWHGDATGALLFPDDEQATRQRLREAVAAILADYPPP